MTSSRSIPYTVESEDLSLPAFVSSYAGAFPQAAIVTQGYCPVDEDEESEEFSSGEIFIACLKKTVRVLHVEALCGHQKVSVPINSTLQFAFLPQQDDGESEKRLGKEWERRVTSVAEVLDMKTLPPAFKVLEDCVDHKQRRVPGGVVLYNISPITMRGLHKKRGIQGVSSNQIAHKFLEGQKICFSSHQDDTRSIPAAFIDSINLPQKARVFHPDFTPSDREAQQNSWMQQLDHLAACVFTARSEDEFLVVKVNVKEEGGMPQNVVSVPLTDKYMVRAITLTNYDLKPIAANRQLIKKASASNILRDPGNPYVAAPIDPTIPDEPDPLEHVYDIIPATAPEKDRGRTASFGSPQELAHRIRQQQQQQQQQQVYDLPGRPLPALPYARPSHLIDALLSPLSQDPRKDVIPPHIIGLINEVHSELLRHNIPFYGSPGSPYVPSYPVNPPLTPQPQRRYQQPVHPARQATATLPPGGWHSGGHTYMNPAHMTRTHMNPAHMNPAHRLHYQVPSNQPLARRPESSRTSTLPTGVGPPEPPGESHEVLHPPANARSTLYDGVARTRQSVTQQMVSGEPNSAPFTSSFQQPSQPPRKPPPPVSPKPSLKNVAAVNTSPGGSPVLVHRVYTGGQHAANVQPDVTQQGTAVAKPGSPLMQRSTAAQWGQTSPVSRPRRDGQKPTPLPKPRRAQSDAFASQQVRPGN